MEREQSHKASQWRDRYSNQAVCVSVHAVSHCTILPLDRRDLCLYMYTSSHTPPWLCIKSDLGLLDISEENESSPLTVP